MKQYTIIGSGQYNWDIIKLRTYPDGFTIGKRNKFEEETLFEEVGGTCGNVMCILSKLGWIALPQLKLINTAEGDKLVDSLQQYGCDTRYVSRVPNALFRRKGQRGCNSNFGMVIGYMSSPNLFSIVVDWEGCGDTISAVFLYELGKLGLPKVSDLTEGQISSARKAATRMATLFTQYYGSKTWLNYV